MYTYNRYQAAFPSSFCLETRLGVRREREREREREWWAETERDLRMFQWPFYGLLHSLLDLLLTPYVTPIHLQPKNHYDVNPINPSLSPRPLLPIRDQAF